MIHLLFDTSVFESLAGAERYALGLGQGGVDRRRAGERTSRRALSDTPDLGPTGRKRLLRADQRRRRRVRTADRLRAGTCPNFVAAREGCDGVLVTDIFIDNISSEATCVG